jgi:lysophospholipase L1-like esterase
MNTVALFFASGDSLYPGAALLALAVTTTPFLRRKWMQILGKLATWIGLAMVVMASSPLDWWMDAIFAAVFLLWFVGWTILHSRPGLATLRFGLATALVALLVTVSTSELLHRRMPEVRGVPSNRLVVIGDSISAGIGGRAPAWPTLFQQRTALKMRNLSLPGAGVAEALSMAREVEPHDSMVLIEIGGNDLLSGVSSVEFGRNLELLFSRLAAPGRVLVMFELPLVPQKIGYGRAQRRLAARYGAFLIPKHCLTDVLGSSDATSDGLHLSEAGALRMATLVERVLCQALTCR